MHWLVYRSSDFLSMLIRKEGSCCSWNSCGFKMKYPNTCTPQHTKCLKCSLFFLVDMGNYPVLGLNDLEHEEKTLLETSVSVFLTTRHHSAEGCRCIFVFVLHVSSFDSGSINIRPFWTPLRPPPQEYKC